MEGVVYVYGNVYVCYLQLFLICMFLVWSDIKRYEREDTVGYIAELVGIRKGIYCRHMALLTSAKMYLNCAVIMGNSQNVYLGNRSCCGHPKCDLMPG